MNVKETTRIGLIVLLIWSLTGCASDDVETVSVSSVKEPAPLAGVTKRFSKDEFYIILESGICYMPSIINSFPLKEKHFMSLLNL